MSAPIRTLVVDDSASMRAVIARILVADGDIEVVGAAPEPAAAREMIKRLDPDVVTLDVEMPGMDGLSFLERIMRLRPMPVVMCSTLTARGADVTIEALRLGAVDCVCKPSGNAQEMEREGARLRDCVRAAAQSRVRVGPSRPIPLAGPAPTGDTLIAVGASTGGVEALFTFIGSLPPGSPPVLVVQHMPAGFTANFAARLNADAAVTVVEARDGQPILPGTVYIAPGGETHMRLRSGGAQRTIRLDPGDLVGGHRPAVDELFRSLEPLGPNVVGVLLTGMGQDGAAGLHALHQAGARTFAQSADSCVVYGMPRAAVELGAVDQSLPIERMADAVLRACAARKDR